MDQLDILKKLQQMMQTYEQLLDARYANLEQRISVIVQNHYEKYGDTLSASLTYNRLEQLKKRIDKEATAQYSSILKDVRVSEEETFNALYLLYAYLIYMFLSEDEGQFTKIAAAGAKVSAAVAIVLWLLKNRKKLFDAFKKEYDDLIIVFKKHKDDYVYNIYMDIRVNLQNEAGYTEVNKQLKKRTLNARYYGVNRFRDVFNLLANYVQEKVYEACKEHVDVNKLWCSMKDSKVRLAHQALDGELAKSDGYFYYQGDRAKRPKGFRRTDLNYGCRCKIFLSFNGKLPRVSAIRDYRDAKYLVKLHDRIDELQKQGKTYIQAVQQAQKDVQAPKRFVEGYLSYENWLEEYGPLAND